MKMSAILSESENAGAVDALSATAEAPMLTPEQIELDRQEKAALASSRTEPTPPGAPGPPGKSDPLIGTVISERIEILKRIGEGGMGVVYRARHRTLDSPLAVKVMQGQSTADHQRFLLEARLASRLRHPNTVYISDFGQLPDGRDYLVMELLRGRLLAKETDAGPLEVTRALRIAIQIARGLQAVHDQGIVHRDMKPENVFLVTQDGSTDFVKLVDFGIAKRVGVASPALASAAQTGASSADVPPIGGAPEPPLTEPGAIMGTPRYMAPEQALGHEVDVRTDQYALGCMLYQMLSGQVPFDGPSAMDIVFKHVQTAPEPLRQRAPKQPISEGLEHIVERLLSKIQSARYPSMREVEAALSHELDLLLVQRGEKRLLSPAVANTIDGLHGGSNVVIGGRSYPLWAVLTWLVLVLVGVAMIGAVVF